MSVLKNLFIFVLAVLLLASCNEGKTPAVTETADVTTTVTEAVTTVTEAETTAVTTVPETEAVIVTTVTEETTVVTEAMTTEAPAPVVQYEPAVYMYHLIMEEPFNSADGLFVRPSDFAAQLDAIVQSGAECLFADEYRLTETPSVMITFDDGYEDNYTTAYPMLMERGLKATIFLITDLIDTPGYLTRAQIREMAQSGVIRFGCHTKSHYDLSQQSAAMLDRQLRISKMLIEDLVGYEVTALAYPSGGYNDLVVSKVAELFEFAYTTKNPDKVSSDNMLLLPRYPVYRDYTAQYVANCIGRR
ncbi:MAG: polysaccharide deacetylase family protein [Clostridia bacterium]|nr:polysaccharide deacetylase family protein [Clostridia bacterium]